MNLTFNFLFLSFSEALNFIGLEICTNYLFVIISCFILIPL